MKCRACDGGNAVAYDPPDYYCATCIESIKKTTGEDFTLGDVIRIILGEDRPVKEYTK